SDRYPLGHAQSSFKGVSHVRAGEIDVKFMVNSDFENLIPLRIRYYPDIILEVVPNKHISSNSNTLRPRVLRPSSFHTFNRHVEGPGSVFQPPGETAVDPQFLKDKELFIAAKNRRQTSVSPSQSPPSPTPPPIITPRRRCMPSAAARPSTSYLEDTDLGRTLDRYSQYMSPEGRKSIQDYNVTFASYVDAVMSGQNSLAENIKVVMRGMAKNHLEVLENERKMIAMQQEALDHLAHLQVRVRALITQTYELSEYPIPRLFIVLPKEPESWNKKNPFTHTFRLFFLCECGEHTKSTASTTLPHHVHLAGHEGYLLQRPTDLFKKYGRYLLTMMETIKYGVVAAGLIVPSLAHLEILDGAENLYRGLAKDTFAPLVDKTIGYLKDQLNDNYTALDGGSTQGRDFGELETLEGPDLRQLVSFLAISDKEKALGNLYRIVTDKGHVKWVCLDHYRTNYLLSSTQWLQDALKACGKFDEQEGKVQVTLASSSIAEQFYRVFRTARGIHELNVKLAWDVTKADLQSLSGVLLESNVAILIVDGEHFKSPALDYINGTSRFDPILGVLASGKLLSFTIKNCPDSWTESLG
ncbi:hypothetical protein BGX26_010034, partial [Mortierella sp. AD094]